MILGKGHEKSMIYGLQSVPWDDREAWQFTSSAREGTVSIRLGTAPPRRWVESLPSADLSGLNRP
ncbi:MAG: hypothetical protein IPN07_04815 [Dehalococcoidia bacterium]|nr:hypothetical protein [Dehalococcoidia bacterium]